ncbi:cation transport protein-domain-containing protein [Aspergillus novoparasiticus]|uniref:Cation transport protein-domain-containing protein n=1 Tax=Aspergillus novoparasiticus TaxID=986946 RepID=A0A5N6EFA7_9EURO|nr:cation transport protein-domain-containing protein [Aspergillus novoparasiticus]
MQKIQKLWSSIRRNGPRINFLTLHYAYFLVVCLLSSIVFWATSTPSRSVRYVDSVFFTFSAMTGAGLNTVDLSKLNTFQQLLLFVLIAVGSPIFVSIGVLLVRRRAFEKRFGNFFHEQESQLSSRSSSRTSALQPSFQETCPEGAIPNAHIHPKSRADCLQPNSAVQPNLRRQSDRRGEEESLGLQRKEGRNSSFHHLTKNERHRLGGVEYRAVCLLVRIVPIYLVMWQLLGGLGIGAYIATKKAVTTETNGVNAWWAGIFFAVSAFNNSGMSLVDANMVPFQSSIYMLITMGLLILAGNTCYPIFLRCILYALLLILPENDYFTHQRHTLRFLLDHPRRCYTNLFPSRHTRWLLCAVIILNGLDWAAFEVLNIDNPSVNRIPPGPRALDGLFQALCVRTGGFYIVAISSLQIGTQVIYVVMMYIAVYPVVITMRSSNVYEERSLGIYAGEPTPKANPLDHHQEKSPKTVPTSRLYFVKQQLHVQLAYDIWWLALAVIIISIVEAGSFTRDPVVYSVFNIIFETISAYGCVGITTGLPDQAYSFSGGWHSLSKVVLCAVMLRGRHRSLPVAIDKAIMLPGEYLERVEEEDAYIRMESSLEQGHGNV